MTTYNCDEHSLGFPMDEPCVWCRDEALGISDMSIEFAKDAELDRQIDALAERATREARYAEAVADAAQALAAELHARWHNAPAIPFESGGSIINGVTVPWTPQPEGGLHGG